MFRARRKLTDLSQINPWLELTDWPNQLRGLNLVEIGPLAGPIQATELALIRIKRIFYSIVESARLAVLKQEINIFDQAIVNSFREDRKRYTRPFAVRLLDSTYKRYIAIGTQLLAFIFRTNPPIGPAASPPPSEPLNAQFGYRLTPTQARLIGTINTIAVPLSDCPSRPPAVERREDERLGELLAELFIALFNHRLGGALRESALVVFLAVLGVDSVNQTFHQPQQYTPYLSALVKLTQLIVCFYSLTQARAAPGTAPADYLRPLRTEFMLSSAPTPFTLLLRLRAQGKTIREATTQEGYLTWSDDYRSLTYREISLNLDRFRGFLVEQGETLLSDLDLLLFPLPSSEAPAPPVFDLTRLVDQPANRSIGWCFIEDERNGLGRFRQFLTARILAAPSLRAEFFRKGAENGAEGAVADLGRAPPLWRTDRVKRYLALETQFLTRLGVLALILGGQPPRGTELTSIRPRNTLKGGTRNIFLEGGLISLVTLYHKGYSMGGTTKTIYRYLPQELSSILVSYLVLVRPFTEYLQQALYRIAPAPYLWARTGGRLTLGHPWETSTLSELLKSETRRLLGELYAFRGGWL